MNKKKRRFKVELTFTKLVPQEQVDRLAKIIAEALSNADLQCGKAELKLISVKSPDDLDTEVTVEFEPA
jgi:tripartite-type tricarboxylate transporter receptor subunit TctC